MLVLLSSATFRGLVPVSLEIVQAVAVYALRPYPVGEREPADLGLSRSEQAHDVETGIPVLRQVASQPFRFLRHSLVNLGFREALGGIGFDTILRYVGLYRYNEIKGRLSQDTYF